MDTLIFEQAKQYFLQRLERELSPNLLYNGITHMRADVVPAVEMFASIEGVQQVIRLTHYGH
jgi:hypothetical protein